MQIAAPALLATLLADLVLGFLGKASPQLPVLFLGLSVKSMVGLAVLALSLKYWPGIFERYFQQQQSTGGTAVAFGPLRGTWRTTTRPNRQLRGGGRRRARKARWPAAASWPAALVGFAGLLVLLWISSAELERWRRHVGAAWTAIAPPTTISAARLPVLTWTGDRGAALDPRAAWRGVAAGRGQQSGARRICLRRRSTGSNLERMSPAKKLGQMFSLAGLAPPAKSLIPFSVLLYFGVVDAGARLGFAAAHGADAGGAIGEFAYQRVFEICWKSTLVLLLWAGIDYLLQRQKLERDLRMSKQELRDEYKETDGNPTVKARLRRLQRQMRRRRMLKDVEHATVVVTNPTHYAVALEYRAADGRAGGGGQRAQPAGRADQAGGALARGPIVENPPLAQALYRSVEVGQTIPAKLYAAVAEILAFIYRAQMRVQNAARQGLSDGDTTLPANRNRRSSAAPPSGSFPVAAVALVFVMLVPLPAFVLDLLLAISITASVLVLLSAVHILRPVQFSVFPSLLLLLTLFRLSLNLASSRRILLHGNEGRPPPET